MSQHRKTGQLSWRRLTVLLASGVTVLAGCSDGGEDPTSYDEGSPLASVVAAVEGAGSVHLSLGTQTRRGEVEMDVTWEDEDAFRAVAGTGTASRLDVRRVDDKVYVGGEAVGLQWTYLEVDDPRLQGEGGFDAGPVPVLLAVDVPGELEALAAAVQETRDLGEEQVEGVTAKHLELTVDSKAWQAELPEESMHAQMDLPETVTMDLWVDEQDLPVRWDYEGQGSTEGGKDDTARLYFTGWGDPVEVKVPGRAQPVE
ncbi:hypothetical protein [Nocardioides gansuensis]|nr:hypothetical protein [Nocardioides gansuensis]